MVPASPARPAWHFLGGSSTKLCSLTRGGRYRATAKGAAIQVSGGHLNDEHIPVFMSKIDRLISLRLWLPNYTLRDRRDLRHSSGTELKEEQARWRQRRRAPSRGQCAAPCRVTPLSFSSRVSTCLINFNSRSRNECDSHQPFTKRDYPL